MLDVVKDSRVLSLGGHKGLRQTLQTLQDQLGRCQKALNEFLEVSTASLGSPVEIMQTLVRDCTVSSIKV